MKQWRNEWWHSRFFEILFYFGFRGCSKIDKTKFEQDENTQLRRSRVTWNIYLIKVIICNHASSFYPINSTSLVIVEKGCLDIPPPFFDFWYLVSLNICRRLKIGYFKQNIAKILTVYSKFRKLMVVKTCDILKSLINWIKTQGMIWNPLGTTPLNWNMYSSTIYRIIICEIKICKNPKKEMLRV